MISYRYLDNFLNPHHLSIHRAVLLRLLPLWLLLSLVFSASAYWIETQRVDSFVNSLAMQAVQRFEQTSPPAMLKAPADSLARQLSQLQPQTQFVGVRLYGADQQFLIESWGEHDAALPDAVGAHTRVFPSPGQHRQSVLRLNGRIYVQALVPLVDAKGRNYGYFEGIYQVAPQTARWIATSIGDTLIGILIVLALSSLALYPVMVTLNRDTLRLTHNLLASNIELMRVLGGAIAKRDSDTDSHNYRVTLYALALAEHLKRPQRENIALMAGAFLHDVGKIGIPDAVLLKPGKLDPQEFSIMKTHVNIGLEIIGEVKWLELAQEVVACHHERYDGSGYPGGLSAEQIPFNARLFSIVDVFDALTSKRPYKQAFTFERAMELMRGAYQAQFDPTIFQAFTSIAPALYQRLHQAQTAQLRKWLAEETEKYFRRSEKQIREEEAAEARARSGMTH